MQSSFSHEIASVTSACILFSLLFLPIFSSTCFSDFQKDNGTSMQTNEPKKTRLISARLRKINKPFVKSIKSPDGDIIDCVLYHLQPAFDHPELKGKMTLSPPELPKKLDNGRNESQIKQLWSSDGESCPDGTIPVKRTSASKIFRSDSILKSRRRFSSKDMLPPESHEYGVAYVKGEYYGAKALLNVWAPNVVGYSDFSLSQIWVMGGAPNHDMNTVEAGWHAYPNMHNDNIPRLFTYWTPDGYQSGCYDLVCPGFIQTSSKFCLGAAIDPISTYDGQQLDLAFFIWKDPDSGDWWLKVGDEVIGYWPQTLFSSLRYNATEVEYGGEVYSANKDNHTSTQMGSGHFPYEGFGRAAYARNLEVVDHDNNLIAASELHLLAEHPTCYDVKNGYSDTWGNYIYFGGPGNNPNCP